MRKFILPMILVSSVFAQGVEAKDKKDPEIVALQRKADLETLKRLEFQFKDVQAQLDAIITPLLKEQSDAKKRLCDSAEIAVDKCDVDLPTGSILVKKTPEVKK